MQLLPPSLARLIEHLQALPGIGPKSAERIAIFLLRHTRTDLAGFADALTNLRTHIRQCERCFLYTETDRCAICTDTTRDQKTLCIVEEPFDVIALEKTGDYKGLYHVLHGALSPLDGLGPEQLTMHQLEDRLTQESIAEVIIATNPSLEGDATALYLTKLLEGKNIRITRIARGMPTGGSLEYADTLTLQNALKNRTQM